MFKARFNQNKLYKKYERQLVKILKNLSLMKVSDFDFLQKQAVSFASSRGNAGFYSSNDVLSDIVVEESVALLCAMSELVLKMSLHSNQIIAGLALYDGYIIELGNGEGKTLAATIPVYLNFLRKVNIHVATANDYLAERDLRWMGPLYHNLCVRSFARLSNKVVLINSDGVVEECARSSGSVKGYDGDVTYASSFSLAYDWLEDNLAYNVEDKNNRNSCGAVIIDEIDYILIDQARTPITISSKIVDDPEISMDDIYRSAALFANDLKLHIDFLIDVDSKSIVIGDHTYKAMQKYFLMLCRGKSENVVLRFYHAVEKSLYANYIMKENVDYIVYNDSVVPVGRDGRPMLSSTYTDGLQQALEMKHCLEISGTTMNKAVVSLQCFYKRYRYLCGMSGTVGEDRAEYLDVYGKNVFVIPNEFKGPDVAQEDYICKTSTAALNRAVAMVKEVHEVGRPVLVCTRTIEKVETMSTLLLNAGIYHTVICAKNHEAEADVLRSAGRAGAVTLVAKMAGRGTDIQLEPGVKEIGGLYVVSIERNLERRDDRQLVGRTGRHGNPGSACFILSLDDELMVLLGADRISSIMDFLGFEDNEAISNSMVAAAIKNAQSRIHNDAYAARKSVYEFDAILDRDRMGIYGLRDSVISSDSCVQVLGVIVGNVFRKWALDGGVKKSMGHDEICELVDFVVSFREGILNPFSQLSSHSRDEVLEWASKAIMQKIYNLQDVSPEHFDPLVRFVILQAIDDGWTRYLQAFKMVSEESFLYANESVSRLDWLRHASSVLYDDTLCEIEKSIVTQLCSLKIHIEESDDSIQGNALEVGDVSL